VVFVRSGLGRSGRKGAVLTPGPSRPPLTARGLPGTLGQKAIEGPPLTLTAVAGTYR
jgi:hypothetical protein